MRHRNMPYFAARLVARLGAFECSLTPSVGMRARPLHVLFSSRWLHPLKHEAVAGRRGIRIRHSVSAMKFTGFWNPSQFS